MPRTITISLLLLVLAACESDPLGRPGTIRASGVNAANLQAMLVDPTHGRLGIGAAGTLGSAAAEPVDRLLTGKRYPLPEAFTTLSGD